jgi:hypothetical protein
MKSVRCLACGQDVPPDQRRFTRVMQWAQMAMLLAALGVALALGPIQHVLVDQPQGYCDSNAARDGRWVDHVGCYLLAGMDRLIS